MSLINNMLKELEQRTKKITESNKTLAGLHSQATGILRKNKHYYLLLLSVLSGFLLLLALALWYKPWTKISAKTRLNPSAQVVIPHANVDKPNSDLTRQDISPHLLTGVALQVQPEMSSLRFLLNQATLYSLNFNVDRNELDMVLDHTSLLAALPKINFVNSGIENIQAFNNEQGNLKLVLSLSSTTEIKRLELNGQGQSPELLVELASTPVSLAGTAPRLNTIPVSVDNPIVENKTEQVFQSALKLSSVGEDVPAIQSLTSLLEGYPAYHQGRELLIRLLIRQGREEEASQMLKKGLELEPSSSLYAELKARLLLEEGKLAQAIQLLEKNAPDLTINPDYHAFLAALYQRQGKASLAASLYQQLLATDPKNAKWWLGLGVAFDAMGLHEQAMEAYENADNAGGLSPELKAYIETQLHGS